MTSALIGHTGFIGSNLRRQRAFDDSYNTANFTEITGQSYDLVVTAANRADSFRINVEPEQDRAEIAAFVDTLATVDIGKLVLVSTVCVYEASPRSDEETIIRPENLTPYGQNRYELERALSERYDTLILRLPQLYGPGLKKGLIFDLINRYRVEHIRPEGVFQYYDLARLWSDTEVALHADLTVLNLATAPLRHSDVAQDVFGVELVDGDREPESPFSAMYTRNMTTVHARLFGGAGDYIVDEAGSLEAIRRFVEQQLAPSPAPAPSAPQEVSRNA